MDLKGKIIKKTSKAGNEYEVLEITYKEFSKEVYLDKAEIQLLRLIDKNNEEPDINMPFLDR